MGSGVTTAGWCWRGPMRYAGRCPRLLKWLWRRFSRVREPAFPVAGTPPQRGCDVECCREIGTRCHGGARFETESVIICGRTASPLRLQGQPGTVRNNLVRRQMGVVRASAARMRNHKVVPAGASFRVGRGCSLARFHPECASQRCTTTASSLSPMRSAAGGDPVRFESSHPGRYHDEKECPGSATSCKGPWPDGSRPPRVRQRRPCHPGFRFQRSSC